MCYIYLCFPFISMALKMLWFVTVINQCCRSLDHCAASYSLMSQNEQTLFFWRESAGCRSTWNSRHIHTHFCPGALISHTKGNNSALHSQSPLSPQPWNFSFSKVAGTRNARQKHTALERGLPDLDLARDLSLSVSIRKKDCGWWGVPSGTVPHGGRC